MIECEVNIMDFKRRRVVIEEYGGTAKGGIGFFGLLTIVFIVLKLLGVIDWWWIWVLAPLWCPPVLAGLGILLLAVICYFTQ